MIGDTLAMTSANCIILLMLSALNIDRLALWVFAVAISDIINIPEFK
ncbi:hypothetical protein [Arsenophonus sp. PmNCSU2021_1]